MATSEAAVLDIQDPTDVESSLQFQDFGSSGTASVGSMSRSGSNLAKTEQIHTFTDFPDTPGSEDDEPENTELLGEEKRPSSSPSSIWSFAYYQSFFDVDTNQVLKRILWSMIPFPKSKFLDDHIRPNPDLYGPFWICATLVFSTAISGNLASYLHNAHNGNYLWKYDFHKVSIAATAIYVYAGVIPLALWVLLWYRKSEAKYTFLEVLCIYGYSLAIYVPVSVVWTIPIDGLRWTLVFVAAALSGSVLLMTMWPAFKEDSKKVALPVMIIILVLHLLLAVGFVMYFFHDTSVPKIDPRSTTIRIEPSAVNVTTLTGKMVQNATKS